MQIDWFSALGADRIIESIQSFLDSANTLIPASMENMIFLFLAVIIFALGIGLVLRLFFGQRCTVNRAISGFLEILAIYSASIVVYTLKPWNLNQYLAPLPFAFFSNDIMFFSVTTFTTLQLLCGQILSLIILCFIVHLLNFLLPCGRSFLPWLLMRVVCIVGAVALDLGANWLLNAFLPAAIDESAPVALLAVLAVALLVSLFNPLLCILFTAANPVIGLLYTFFFSNTIGKNLTRAVLSAALACALFYAMEYFGYGVIDITPGALLRYAPFAAVLIGVWFVYDYKL